MKRPSPIVTAMALLWGSLCFGQAKVPASLVSVSTNDFQNFVLTESLYGTSAPTGRVQYTAQHLFDWLDDNWADASVTSSNWNFLSPTADTAQATFDFIDANSMPGTNIAGFAFNPTNKSWTPPAAVAYADHYASVVDTNLTGASNWYVQVWTNWDAATNGVNGDWSTSAVTNVTAVFYHPAYVTADGIMFPSFVTKEEFYAILNQMGFANVDWYTYYSADPSLYGSSTNPPDDNSAFISAGQYYTVPEDLVDGQEIEVHCWGGGHQQWVGSYGLSGGYSFGVLTVHTGTAFQVTNAGHVTTGMVLAVHVGSTGGRAAVWRISSNPSTEGYFDSYTNELIVAGGPGGGGGSMSCGGFGGGTNGGRGLAWVGSTSSAGAGGYGGSQTNGGLGVGGYNGDRVWGGAPGGSGYVSPGGDGYWGGGGGDGNSYVANHSSGGGSGYVHPQLAGTNRTPRLVDGAYPPPEMAGDSSAYGLNAGYPGNPGRVAFVIKFTDWK